MGSVQRSVFGLVAVGAALAMAGCGQVADGGAAESTTGGAAESTTGGGDATAMSPSRGGAGGASSPDAAPGAGEGPSAGAGPSAGRAGIPEPVPLPTEPAGKSCGVLWGVVERSALPADGALVGSYNGKPFEIPAERALAELECPSPLSAPPALHLSFELDELVFVIRGCQAFVYLPDLSAVDLTMSAEATVEPNAVLDGSTAAGHWVLRAPATATTDARDHGRVQVVGPRGATNDGLHRLAAPVDHSAALIGRPPAYPLVTNAGSTAAGAIPLVRGRDEC
jgi:hypothetical protein